MENYIIEELTPEQKSFDHEKARSILEKMLKPVKESPAVKSFSSVSREEGRFILDAPFVGRMELSQAIDNHPDIKLFTALSDALRDGLDGRQGRR